MLLASGFHGRLLHMAFRLQCLRSFSDVLHVSCPGPGLLSCSVSFLSSPLLPVCCDDEMGTDNKLLGLDRGQLTVC